MKKNQEVAQTLARKEVKMLQVERYTQIRAFLEQKNTLRIGQLAKLLYVSEATVRRDVDTMEKTDY